MQHQTALTPARAVDAHRANDPPCILDGFQQCTRVNLGARRSTH